MDGDGYIFSLALVKYFFTSKLHITADCRLKIRSADRNHVRHRRELHQLKMRERSITAQIFAILRQNKG